MGIYENTQRFLTDHKTPIAVLTAIGIAKLAYGAVREMREKEWNKHRQYNIHDGIIEMKPALSHGYDAGPTDPLFQQVMEQRAARRRESIEEVTLDHAPDEPLTSGKPRVLARIRGETYTGSGIFSGIR